MKSKKVKIKGKITISIYELMKKFPDEESARIYFENKRWKGTPVCPQCGSSTNQYKQYRIDKKTGLKKAGYYLCYHCKLVYTVRTGTIFERSHIPLNVWFLAIYKIVTARKGISSLQLSKEIGVRQGTAWFMQHRIREACSNNSPLLKGEIEADEAYFGGKEGNKHASKKLNAGRGTVGKIAVLGMRERDGRLHAKVIKDTTAKTIQDVLNSVIEKDSTLYTDEHKSYLGNKFNHKIVNHSAKQFVDGMAYTNGIESVWAVLKRGYYGIHHNFSKKHLQRYIDEYAFRFNEGNVKYHTMNRIDSLLDKSKGKRLTYKRLKSGESETLNNKKGIAVMQEETKNKIKMALKVGSIYSGGAIVLGDKVIHEHQNCDDSVSRNYKIVTHKINSIVETE